MAHKFVNMPLEQCKQLNVPCLTHVQTNGSIDYIYSLWPTTFTIPITLQLALHRWLSDYKAFFHMQHNYMFDYDISSVYVIIVGIPEIREVEILERLHDMLEPQNLKEVLK